MEQITRILPRLSVGRVPKSISSRKNVVYRKILQRHKSAVAIASKERDQDEFVKIDSEERQAFVQREAREKTVDLEFSNAQEAYKSKTTFEIFRALFVFKMCTYDLLVDYNKELLKYGRMILGKRLFEKIMQATFYGHFVAGADQPDIKPNIERLSKFGVGAVLDYGVEEDIPHSKAVEVEMESCISKAEDAEIQASRDKKFVAYEQFGDRRHDVASARTYFYEDEEKCDENMKFFLKCIDAAGASSRDGFAAIKLTALGRPQMLLQFSECLTAIRNLFVTLAGTDGDLVDRKISSETFQSKLESMGIMTRDTAATWFTLFDYNEDGLIDLLDWDRLMQPDLKMAKVFRIPNLETGQMDPLLMSLTDDEDRQMKTMLVRMNTLAERAKEKGVRLMIDAEQSYFQPAISRLAMELMRKFNTEKPVIFNTYQCYLTGAYDNMTVDMEYARNSGFCFGAKLVRGAYLDQERKRAREIGYDDPCCASYEATNENYMKVLNTALEKIKRHGGINIMVASHNEDSIRFTVERMNTLCIGRRDKLVYFGQLLGMCDQVTFSLGQAGYAVYKYVPYGPVEEVLPYLTRRAIENRGLLKGVVKERTMLRQELFRRLKTGNIFYKP
ncbi:proline dehydrogenase 1, mitochondrial-like isoform X1 [Ptychodera flava]|uniref:proline dehydrogenase 1, mitochondrial-like isoform X1 n=1 Tax=Ptychodera flava TaxID=63121 RepID=UPI00396A0260